MFCKIRENWSKDNCGVTICSPSPKELGYEPNELNTINFVESE